MKQILLSDEDPCEGCDRKVDDDYGRFCDIACGKHSTYLIKQDAYKAQLKEVVEMLQECDGDLVSRDNKPFMATFEMLAADWEALLREVK